MHGTDNVPLAIELAFRREGTLSGVRKLADTADAYMLDEGFGRCQTKCDTIEFGPGHSRHTWTELRGALPKLDAKCVYLTGYTPFTHELTIS